MNIESHLQGLATLGAGWVMWLLCALSVASVAVMLDRALLLVRTRDDVARLHAELVALLAQGAHDAADELLAASRSFEARIVRAGLQAAERGAGAVEERMAGATQLAKLELESKLAFLGTVGSNAPFVGLLGTVIGIVRAFAELQASAGQVSAGLMSEVGEALIATAIGIVVALPAIAAFNALQRAIKVRLGRADALGRELLASLRDERRPTARQATTLHAKAA